MLSSLNDPSNQWPPKMRFCYTALATFNEDDLLSFLLGFFIFCVVLYPFEDFGEEENVHVYSQFVIHTSILFLRIVSKR